MRLRTKSTLVAGGLAGIIAGVLGSGCDNVHDNRINRINQEISVIEQAFLQNAQMYAKKQYSEEQYLAISKQLGQKRDPLKHLYNERTRLEKAKGDMSSVSVSAIGGLFFGLLMFYPMYSDSRKWDKPMYGWDVG